MNKRIRKKLARRGGARRFRDAAAPPTTAAAVDTRDHVLIAKIATMIAHRLVRRHRWTEFEDVRQVAIEAMLGRRGGTASYHLWYEARRATLAHVRRLSSCVSTPVRPRAGSYAGTPYTTFWYVTGSHTEHPPSSGQPSSVDRPRELPSHSPSPEDLAARADVRATVRTIVQDELRKERDALQPLVEAVLLRGEQSSAVAREHGLSPKVVWSAVARTRQRLLDRVDLQRLRGALA